MHQPRIQYSIVLGKTESRFTVSCLLTNPMRNPANLSFLKKYYRLLQTLIDFTNYFLIVYLQLINT